MNNIKNNIGKYIGIILSAILPIVTLIYLNNIYPSAYSILLLLVLISLNHRKEEKCLIIQIFMYLKNSLKM